MASENLTKPNVGTVCDALKKSYAINGNDVDATLEHLHVPVTEMAQAKEQLKKLLSGNSETLAEWEAALGEEGEAANLTAAK